MNIEKIHLFKNAYHYFTIQKIGKESLPIYYTIDELIITNDEIYICSLENKVIGFIIFEFDINDI